MGNSFAFYSDVALQYAGKRATYFLVGNSAEHFTNSD
jgi:hypothetical protein